MSKAYYTLGSFVFIWSQSDQKQTSILGWQNSGYLLSLMTPLLKAELFQDGKTVLAVRPLVSYGCQNSTVISIQLNMPVLSMSLIKVLHVRLYICNYL